jgi:YD repeat-containing protein
MHTNGYDFTYDADGNLERKVRPGYDDLQLGWNSLGQMTTAWRYQRGSASYGYDALGRRVQRVDGNGSVARYLYDGDDLLMELNASGQPIREYTHNPGVDRPHAVRMKCESRGGLTYHPRVALLIGTAASTRRRAFHAPGPDARDSR